jgi:hypothetical protein
MANERETSNLCSQADLWRGYFLLRLQKKRPRCNSRFPSAKTVRVHKMGSLSLRAHDFFAYFRHCQNPRLCVQASPSPLVVGADRGPEEARPPPSSLCRRDAGAGRGNQQRVTPLAAAVGSPDLQTAQSGFGMFRWEGGARDGDGVQAACDAHDARRHGRLGVSLLGQGHHSLSPLLPCPGDAYLVVLFPWSSGRACPTPEFSSQP